MYCRKMHGGDKSQPCAECAELLVYAEQRMAKCVYGENKPTCAQCPVHCYRPVMREKVRKVMRYAGPRMLWHSPILTIRYMYRKRNKRPEQLPQ